MAYYVECAFVSRVVLNTKLSGAFKLGVDLEESKRDYLDIAGAYLDKVTQLNLSSGRGFEGGAYPSTQKWTRKATGYNRNSKTLNRTGSLKKSHRVKARNDRKGEIRYGATGRYVKISDEVIEGGRREMRVTNQTIWRGENGGQYIRVRSNDGQWYTKRVINGFVSINVAPRPYMGLNSSNYKELEELFDAIVN